MGDQGQEEDYDFGCDEKSFTDIDYRYDAPYQTGWTAAQVITSQKYDKDGNKTWKLGLGFKNVPDADPAKPAPGVRVEKYMSPRGKLYGEVITATQPDSVKTKKMTCAKSLGAWVFAQIGEEFNSHFNANRPVILSVMPYTEETQRALGLIPGGTQTSPNSAAPASGTGTDPNAINF